MKKFETHKGCDIDATARHRTEANTYYALYTISRDPGTGEVELIVQQDDPTDVAFATAEEALEGCIAKARQRIDSERR